MCQGFFLIVTRAKSEFFCFAARGFGVCSTTNPAIREKKTSGTLGIRMTTCFGRREKPQPELEKRRENKFRN